MTIVSEFRKDPMRDRLYVQEQLILDVTERLCSALDQSNTSRAELAKRLGITKSAVSQMLDGSNLQLRSIADICWAIHADVGFEVLCEEVDAAFYPNHALWCFGNGTEPAEEDSDDASDDDFPEAANCQFAVAA